MLIYRYFGSEEKLEFLQFGWWEPNQKLWGLLIQISPLLLQMVCPNPMAKQYLEKLWQIPYMLQPVELQHNHKSGISKFKRSSQGFFFNSNWLFIDICYIVVIPIFTKGSCLWAFRQVLLWWRAKLKWFCQTVPGWGVFHRESQRFNQCEGWVPFTAIELLEKKSHKKMILGGCWPENDWFPKIDEPIKEMLATCLVPFGTEMLRYNHIYAIHEIWHRILKWWIITASHVSSYGGEHFFSSLVRKNGCLAYGGVVFGSRRKADEMLHCKGCSLVSSRGHFHKEEFLGWNGTGGIAAFWEF